MQARKEVDMVEGHRIVRTIGLGQTMVGQISKEQDQKEGEDNDLLWNYNWSGC